MEWSLAEDYRLLKLIAENNGQKKWSRYCKFFPNRSEHGLKNRYHVLFGEKIMERVRGKGKTELERIVKYLEIFGKKYPHLPAEYLASRQVLVEEDSVDYLRLKNRTPESEEEYELPES